MNDHDIEATLRATFAGRANTVATGPVWAEGDDAEVLDTQRRRPHRPQRWAPLAAAAAVLLAVGGAIVGAQQLGGNPRPAGPNSISPTTTPTNTGSTPSPSPTRTLTTTGLSTQLHWDVGVDIPAGYQLRERVWTPPFQTITLRKLDDPDAIGCCGGLPTTDYITVYSRGAYNAAGVKAGQPVNVGSGHGWFAKRRDQDFDGEIPLSHEALPTVSWQYAPNAWAVVRATTPETQQLDQLLQVAAAVRTGASSPIRTPVRLDYLTPGLSPVRIVEDTNEKYGTTFEFAGPVNGLRADLTIQVWSTPGPAESLKGASRILVGGRPGYLLDPSSYGNAAYVRIGGHSVEFGFDGDSEEISDNSSTLGATALREILAGARWSSNPADPRTWFDARRMLP